MSTIGNNLFAVYYAQQNFGPRSNEVWYYADSKVTLYSEANVVSHEFADGKGVITYNANLTSMPNIFMSTLITGVVFPNGITSISSQAFRYCENLYLDKLPSGLTIIGNYAFQRCLKLALTNIPDSIINIGNNSFSFCSGLTSLIFDGTPTSISATAFRECRNLTTIRVPWSSTDEINVNAPWGATNAQIVYNYQA